MKSTALLVTAWILTVGASSAFADIITGRVVDSNGLPVPNVDIDIDNQGGGGDPPISNDFTDANGVFSIVVPSGVYDVFFLPPAPPATTHLAKVLSDVAVIGTQNLGQLTLDPGVALTGRAVNSSGLPVSNVDLDVIDGQSGLKLLTPADNTNAFGQFSIAVPLGESMFQMDPTPVAGQTLVGKEFELNLNGGTTLGDVLLENGTHVTGRFVGPGGAGVANADIDLFRLDGSKVYTPKDNTNATGFFDIVAPFAPARLTLCPPNGSTLVAAEFGPVQVSGPTNVGTIATVQGVEVSGFVSIPGGGPASGMDIDVIDSASQLPVVVCNDNIQSNGTYSIRLAPGVYDFVFEPTTYDIPIGADVHTGVSVFGTTTLNGSMPACSFPSSYGFGTAGSGGIVPTLSTFGGAPRVDNPDFGFVVDQVVGGTIGAVVFGFGQASLPLFGGTILIDIVQPTVMLPYSSGGASGVAGSGGGSIPVQIVPDYAGLSIWVQAYAVDLGIPSYFLALSNGVELTFCE